MDQIAQNPFEPLPMPEDVDGKPRACGVEIELTGLEEGQVAKLCARELGGEVFQDSETDWRVEGSSLGKLEVYLDTALRKTTHKTLLSKGLKLGREVIPVEIVTEPLDRSQLRQLDTLREVLRIEGAEGSRAGWLYGFGVHLNVAIASRDAKGITAPMLAYALIEDWMRDAHPIDHARRVLPFTAPYSTATVRALARAGICDPREAMQIYLDHAASRNHGLDMLPIFAELDRGAVDGALGEENSVKGRPAFHFRLPDCRIDEEGWSLAEEWQRWRFVEQVAADEALVERLSAAWLDDHGRITLSRQGWAERCGDILLGAGVIRSKDAA